MLPFLLVAVVAVFAVLSSRMTPQEDITAFLPDKEGYGRISEAYSNIRAANMVMVTVSSVQDADDNAFSRYRLMDVAYCKSGI